MTRIKICGVRSESDLRAAVGAGADAVGFQLGQLYPSDAFILSSTAQRLAADLPPYVTPVLVTHLAEAEEIFELVEKSGITTVQLHGYDPDETARLRDLLPPGAKLIQTLYAAELTNRRDFEKFYPLVDAFNLDCFHASAEFLESAEGSYDEDRIGEFVGRSLLPVLLSGRLNAGRAAAFAKKFHPCGVDSCGDLRNSSGAIDAEKAAAFVRAVRLSDYGIDA